MSVAQNWPWGNQITDKNNNDNNKIIYILISFFILQLAQI